MGKCDFTIQDLESGLDCSSMMSGIKKVVFMRKEDVATWPTHKTIVPGTSLMEDNVTVVGGTMNGTTFIPAMTMKSGKRAFVLFSKEDAGSLVYEGQGEKYSRSQKATLTVYNPGFKKALLGFIAAVQNASMIMFVKTNQDEWHMIGDKDRGAVMESNNATSGQATGDANGAEMTFTWDTVRPQIVELGDELADFLSTDSSQSQPDYGTITFEAEADTTDADSSNHTITIAGEFTPGDDGTLLNMVAKWGTQALGYKTASVVPDQNNEFTVTDDLWASATTATTVYVTVTTYVADNNGGIQALESTQTLNIN